MNKTALYSYDCPWQIKRLERAAKSKKLIISMIYCLLPFFVFNSIIVKTCYYDVILQTCHDFLLVLFSIRPFVFKALNIDYDGIAFYLLFHLKAIPLEKCLVSQYIV